MVKVKFILYQNYMLFSGYIEKELKKDGLKIPDSDANPKAPAPKEMVDLEVTGHTLVFLASLIFYLFIYFYFFYDMCKHL